MTVLADFVVANNQPANAPAGKWKSAPFEAGGRLIRKDNRIGGCAPNQSNDIHRPGAVICMPAKSSRRWRYG